RDHRCHLPLGARELRPSRPGGRARPHLHRPAPAVTAGSFGDAPRPEPRLPPQAPRDPLWFKRAVFYQVLIPGFAASDRDGTGDLQGLINKLDYLEWLGVDCLWLLPIYESPLRDGGYDISDYFRVLPEFGDLGDFVNLVDDAHRRGIRIIADLVMNHTSDQH